MKKIILFLFIFFLILVTVFAESKNTEFNSIGFSFFVVFWLLKLSSLKTAFFLLGFSFFLIAFNIGAFKKELENSFKKINFNYLIIVFIILFFFTCLVANLIPSSRETLLIIKTLKVLDSETFNSFCSSTNNRDLLILENKEK